MLLVISVAVSFQKPALGSGPVQERTAHFSLHDVGSYFLKAGKYHEHKATPQRFVQQKLSILFAENVFFAGHLLVGEMFEGGTW